MKDQDKYIEWADRETLEKINVACCKLAALAPRMMLTKEEREFVRVLREIRDISNSLHFDALEVLMEIGATRVDPETDETYDVNDVVFEKQKENEDES